MKLTKLFANNFSQTHLQNRQQKRMLNDIVRTLRDYEALRVYLPQIFPDTETTEKLYTPWRREAQDHQAYTTKNLPMHTRDNPWLSKYVEHIIKDSKHIHGARQVKFDNIRTFVEIDPEFAVERERYEYDVVRAEIKDQILAPESDALLHLNPHAEESFRDLVTENMLQFGLDPHIIEAGLEKNARLWRRAAMSCVFDEQFLLPIVTAKNNFASESQYRKVYSKVAAHRGDWLALREYQYYQKHQAIIDELELGTANMKMKSHEVALKNMLWNHTIQKAYPNTNAPTMER